MAIVAFSISPATILNLKENMGSLYEVRTMVYMDIPGDYLPVGNLLMMTDLQQKNGQVALQFFAGEQEYVCRFYVRTGEPIGVMFDDVFGFIQ